MRTLKITFLFIFLSFSALAQSGMIFQGIARDNNSAAITDKVMTFTFRITKSDGTDLYRETQQIRTDNFGVYSHIIGTGNAVTNTFANVNFDTPDLKAIISVNNGGVNTQIYDQPFQYTAYAKYAQNGVPIGTVVAFMGDLDKIPDGWMLADGRNITGADYTNLRAVLGNANNVPNLRGEFLKGAGTTVDATNISAVNVRQRQIQNVGRHWHYYDRTFQTNTDGAHRHQIKHQRNGFGTLTGNDWHLKFGYQDTANGAYSDATPSTAHPTLTHKYASSAESTHSHTVRVFGDTQHRVYGNVGGQEHPDNRPDNVGVYWIIRYK